MGRQRAGEIIFKYRNLQFRDTGRANRTQLPFAAVDATILPFSETAGRANCTKKKQDTKYPKRLSHRTTGMAIELHTRA